MKWTPLQRKPRAFEASHSKKRKKDTPMGRCDALARRIVLARGRCETNREHKGGLQWAHIQPRTYHFVRHDEDNALALCLGCHVYFTHRPVEFVSFVGEERWMALHRRALDGLGQKIDWKAREAALRARAEELGV